MAFDQNGNYIPLQYHWWAGDSAASDTTAEVLRANYENWKKNYFPTLQSLLDQTTYNNPDLVKNETAKATGQVDEAFNTASSTMDNTMARYGLSVDPASQDVTSLSKVAAQVGAQNQTRQYLADRDKSIMLGMPKAVSTT